MADKYDAFLDAEDDALDAFLDAPTEQAPAPQQQRGLMEKIAGPAIQTVEGALPFIKPLGEGLGAAGRQAVKGYEAIEQLSALNQGADSPQAALAGGIKKVAEFVLPQNKEQAYMAIGGEAFAPEIPGILKSVRKGIAGPVANFMKMSAGIQERYGRAVIMNPDILTTAENRQVAQSIYGAAVKRMKGAIGYAQEKFDTFFPSNQSLESLADDAAKKLGITPDMINDGIPFPPSNISASPPDLQEVLAARQAVENMLTMAKNRDPRMLAQRRSLIYMKDAFDTYLEDGLPGFKNANKQYFEANAREAFETWLPRNKDLSPNALRGMVAASRLSAAVLQNSPWLALEAIPMSPRALGLGIRMGNQAFRLAESYSAQFAARIAAQRMAAEDPK